MKVTRGRARPPGCAQPLAAPCQLAGLLHEAPLQHLHLVVRSPTRVAHFLQQLLPLVFAFAATPLEKMVTPHPRLRHAERQAPSRAGAPCAAAPMRADRRRRDPPRNPRAPASPGRPAARAPQLSANRRYSASTRRAPRQSGKTQQQLQPTLLAGEQRLVWQQRDSRGPPWGASSSFPSPARSTSTARTAASASFHIFTASR